MLRRIKLITVIICYTDETLNISKEIPTSLGNENEHDGSVNPRGIVGIAGWLADDEALLMYDNYDIWQVDPKSSKPPLNVSNGYEQKHHIKLRLLTEDPSRIYASKEILLLTAYNTLNKYNGFFRKSLQSKGDPELLNMEPYNFYRSPLQCPGWNDIQTIESNRNE